jgi:hypothetical protein
MIDTFFTTVPSTRIYAYAHFISIHVHAPEVEMMHPIRTLWCCYAM